MAVTVTAGQPQRLQRRGQGVGSAARRAWTWVWAWAGAFTGLMLHAGTALAQPAEAPLREQVLMLPAAGPDQPGLEVTVYRPPGDGPHPVVLINHGRAAGNPRLQPRYRPQLAAAEFVRRGYAVVVPMRPGFSLSGGVEPSAGCRVQASGEQQAHTVRRTLDWLAARPWADVSRNIVLGQSAGGLVTLAYGTDPHPGTRLLVNFAGGLKLQGCAQWPHHLVQAIADYGQRTPLPSLWFYGDNDSYFPPEVWRAAHQGYSQAGGRAELVAFGTFGHDAHAMFGSREGLAVWVPRLMAALAALGLPSTPLPRLAAAPDIAMPPASGYAQVAELHRVPVRTAPGQAAYQAWLQADRPRAFAVQPRHGAWASAWGGEQPLARALAHCEREAGGAACRLYAVDDTVVWSNE